MDSKYRNNISNQIAEDIKKKIINGELKIGERLPSEFTLCEMYKASRSTIRSTLQILVTLGLIETKFGSGSYVKNNRKLSIISEVRETSLMDIYVIRKLLEPNICKYICEKITDVDIQELVHIITKIEKNTEDINEMKCAIAQFHLKLSVITKNDYIIKTMSKVFDDLASYDDYKVMTNIEIYYHKEILKALLQKDVAAVGSLMAIYIDEFGENIS